MSAYVLIVLKRWVLGWKISSTGNEGSDMKAEDIAIGKNANVYGD